VIFEGWNFPPSPEGLALLLGRVSRNENDLAGFRGLEKLKPIPEGYHTAPPYLIIKYPAKAIEFYKKAFGAKKDQLAPLCVAIVGQVPMIHSFTQISQYLRCPRSYRYRYLDGWREKETRAAMVFGRCFEAALGAYFRGEDCGAAPGTARCTRYPLAGAIRAG